MALGNLFSSEGTQHGPLIATRVLNKDECGVAAVGTTFLGKLCYRELFKGFPTDRIKYVIFLSSVHHKENRPARSVEAEFDIYTEDGRVIEVHSFDRKIIEAAVKLAPTKDVRAKYRQGRGR